MKTPSFDFYYQDFLVGTSFMSLEATGAYILCLCHQAHKNAISIDQIKAICMNNESIIEQVLPKFITDESTGLLYNERCRIEVDKKTRYAASRSNNRKKKEVTKKEIKHVKEKDADGATEGVIDLTNELNVPFEFWWDEYRKKVGNIKKLQKKWAALKDEERQQAFDHTKLYVASTPDKTYRKNPETYINNKSWNDEIIKKTEHNGNGSPKRSLGEKFSESNSLANAFARQSGSY